MLDELSQNMYVKSEFSAPYLVVVMLHVLKSIL